MIMKKIYLFMCIILITSCGWEKEVKVEFKQDKQIQQEKIKQETTSLDVPEKNISKIQEAKNLTIDENINHGSTLKIEPNQEEIEIQKTNNTFTFSNWVVITQEIPENFLENFSDIFAYPVYSNSKVDWYAFWVDEDFDFKSIAQNFITALESQSWKLEQTQLPEENFNAVRLHFTKQSDTDSQDFSIHFSNQVPKLFQEKEILEGKFIEFQYNRFDTSLIN